PSSALLHPALHSFPTRRSSDLGIMNTQVPINENKIAQTVGISVEKLIEVLSFLDSHEILEFIPMSKDPKIMFNWDRQLEKNIRRSEEHTSELQSRENLVCRLLL